MNSDTAKGNWNQLKGKIKENWGKLTDDEIAEYQGKSENFFGKLQEKYGIVKEEAERKISQFSKNSNRDTTTGADVAADSTYGNNAQNLDAANANRAKKPNAA